MRTVFMLSILFALPIVAAAQMEPECKTESAVVKLSEPVETTGEYDVYGSAWKSGDEFIGIGEAIQTAAAISGREARFTGSVEDVCQVKGCWMVVAGGGKQARVHFAGYSFFVPSDIKGKKVEFAGVLTEKIISEEQAKHYAEDSNPGSSDSVAGPQKEYSIVATSVKVYK